MMCVVYVFALTLGLGAAAVLLDYALPIDVPRRWLWLGALVVSIGSLPFALLHRSPGVIRVLGRTVAVLGGPTHAGDGAFAHNNAWLASNDLFRWIIVPVWSVAAAVLFALAAVHAWILWRATQRGTTMGTTDGARIVRTEGVGPAATSVGRQMVLLPPWVFALPRRDRRFVIRHELEHVRHGDDRLLFATSAFVALFPWILPLWWQLWHLRIAVEMDCDARVIKGLGQPAAYGELLLRVTQAQRPSMGLWPGFFGRPRPLERRLRRLIDRSPRPRSARVLAATVALALAATVLTMTHPVGRHDGQRSGTRAIDPTYHR